jgi:RimJ/RimL family protein N-acetyltransferase
MIETPRLILRAPQPGDWPAYRAYRFSPRSTVAGEDEALVWTLFAALFGHWTLRGFGRFIAVLRATGQAIGHFGPLQTAAHPEPELTWTLWDPAAEGQGLAFEAAAAVRDHVFGALGWSTAVSVIDAGNLRSQRLAVRLGAVRDAASPSPLGPDTQVWRHRRAA